MTRVLFVDDEPHVLEGLRDALRPQRRQWRMTFATSGEEAVELLAAQPFDVVVTDMRMPGMDGAALLARAKELQPSTARIVLSGHAERGMALRAARVAHLFLAKPCEVEELRRAIARTVRIRELLADEDLRRATAGCGSLPSVPEIYAELTDLLEREDADATEVARIVARDISMSAKVLQLVNSAFFGLGRPVASIAEAVAYLGVDTIKLLVLSTSAFEVLGRAPLESGSLERLQRHSQLVARIAVRLSGDRPPPELMTAGLLHDVGKLVLATYDAAHYREVLAVAERERQPMHAVELRDRTATHAEVGAFLLDLWGLPQSIVEAVADHHDPWRAGEDECGPGGVLHVADALAHELDAGADVNPWPAAPLDEGRIERHGHAGLLPAWREIAAEEAQALAAPPRDAGR